MATKQASSVQTKPVEPPVVSAEDLRFVYAVAERCRLAPLSFRRVKQRLAEIQSHLALIPTNPRDFVRDRGKDDYDKARRADVLALKETAYDGASWRSFLLGLAGDMPRIREIRGAIGERWQLLISYRDRLCLTPQLADELDLLASAISTIDSGLSHDFGPAEQELAAAVPAGFAELLKSLSLAVGWLSQRPHALGAKVDAALEAVQSDLILKHSVLQAAVQSATWAELERMAAKGI